MEVMWKGRADQVKISPVTPSYRVDGDKHGASQSQRQRQVQNKHSTQQAREMIHMNSCFTLLCKFCFVVWMHKCVLWNILGGLHTYYHCTMRKESRLNNLDD